MAALKGIHTKPNVWDEARKLKLYRREPECCGPTSFEKLDPGVNFFVAMLDQLGATTTYSCEGHPEGFYVAFFAPYSFALRLHRCGYFSVEVHRKNYWSIRVNSVPSGSSSRKVLGSPDASHVDHLRWAADAWERHLGKLDFKKIRTKL